MSTYLFELLAGVVSFYYGGIVPEIKGGSSSSAAAGASSFTSFLLTSFLHSRLSELSL